MCRLLGYLGSAIQLDQLLYKPEHSLVVQSYKPQEMNEAILNADGFGIGWYHPQKETLPYTYKNTQPIWGDLNLPQLSRYIESRCLLGYVRSATPGLAVDLSNCQPFTNQKLLFFHNGYIKNFRQTLYRPIRNFLSDDIYQWVQGTTDSEHICALMLHELETSPGISLTTALAETLTRLTAWAKSQQVYFYANILLSDGKQLVACRYGTSSPVPSFYWLRDDPIFPNSVILASEPLFQGNWQSFPENCLIQVTENLEVLIESF